MNENLLGDKNGQGGSEPSVNQKIDVIRKTAGALFEEIRSVDLPAAVRFKDEISLNDEVRQFETQLIEHALEQSGGSQIRAAKLLNINYSTLNSKIKRYGLYAEDEILRGMENINGEVEITTEGLSREDHSDLESKQFESKEKRFDLNKQIADLKQVIISLIKDVETMRTANVTKVQEEISLPIEMRKFEVQLIQSALSRTKGNQTRAAKLLGVNVTTLNNKIKRLSISPIIKFYSRFSSESAAFLQENCEQ